jgi:Holliday junction resolvasome RuvABC endonuclease subunit
MAKNTQGPVDSSVFIAGIDPGTTESGLAIIHQSNAGIVRTDKISNVELLAWLRLVDHRTILVVEDVVCQGGMVGKSTFETCKVIGRIQEIAEQRDMNLFLYSRSNYARYFIGKTRKVTDALLYDALRKRFKWERGHEPKDVKGASDKRSAYAIALYHWLEWAGPTINCGSAG